MDRVERDGGRIPTSTSGFSQTHIQTGTQAHTPHMEQNGLHIQAHKRLLKRSWVWHSSTFCEKLKIWHGIISVSRKMLRRAPCLMEPISMAHRRSLSFLTECCCCKMKGTQHRMRRNKLCGFCERKMMETVKTPRTNLQEPMLDHRCWWDVRLDLHAPG